MTSVSKEEERTRKMQQTPMMMSLLMKEPLLLLLLLIPALTVQRSVYFPEDLARHPLALESNPNATCAKSSSVGFKCPEGFSLHQDAEGAICLWLSPKMASQRSANDTCLSKGGYLVSIRSRARQETIQKFLKGVNNEVWTGGYKPEGKTNYTWRPSENVTYTPLENGFQYLYLDWEPFCIRLGANESRMWEEVMFCEGDASFVCDLQPECKPNRYGPACGNECHCLGEPCQGGQPCQSGCHAGWTGPHCCQKKEPADVAYYCVRKQSERYLKLRVDPKTTSYEVVQLVDASGVAQVWCQYILTERDAQDFTYIIQVPVLEPDSVGQPEPEPNCGREKTGNNTYRWRISMQEKAGLLFPYDRTLLITCDFNNAEAMSRGAQYSIQSDNERELGDLDPSDSLEPKREDIALELVDPNTGEVIHQANLGRTVMLRLHLNVSGEVTAQSVSPFDCTVSGEEGKHVSKLTDNQGCPEDSAVVSSFQGSNGTVTTKGFPLFAVPGQGPVTISCKVEFCFRSPHPMCDDRCRYYTGRGKRKRISGEEPQSVSTTVRIVQAHEP